LVIEGAINLIEKVGKNWEDNIKTTKAGPKKEEKEKKFSYILEQFDKLMKLPDDEKSAISKRIKLLIKNMFSNKETGW
jgi:hypothetical protein